MSSFIYFDLAFCLTEQLAKRPFVDTISAELKVLKTEHSSLKNFLKESSEKETKDKREPENQNSGGKGESLRGGGDRY
jgi:hypothetical protein